MANQLVGGDIWARPDDEAHILAGLGLVRQVKLICDGELSRAMLLVASHDARHANSLIILISVNRLDDLGMGISNSRAT